MVYNQTLTIWELPPQPLLPVNDIRDPVFVTIWLAGSFAAAFYLRNLLKRSQNPTWQEFRAVRYGALCLAIWYLARATDRWLRYDQRTVVKYGYALAEPMIDTLRVTSAILILWGTYTVVWKELESQFSPKQQGIWWFAARFLLFIVTLMAIFYVILSIALSVVWLEFFNLNSIADIAGKRNDFEMAMTAFFFLFSLLTLVEATVAWFHAFKIHGQAQRTRLFMWLAALFLFVRSISELAIVSDLFKFRATRQDMKFTSDVSYGFITMLYFAMMCIMANVAASTFDNGGLQARMVASDIRHYILAMLHSETNGGRRESPALEEILKGVEDNLDMVLADGPLTGRSAMLSTYKEAVAMDCVDQIRAEFRDLDPREDNHDNTRPPSALSVLTALLGRQSRQSFNMSNTTLNTQAALPRHTVSRPTAPIHFRELRGMPHQYSDAPRASPSQAATQVHPIPGASPPPSTYNDGSARWTPSLGTFPEHPQSHQGTVAPPFPRPSISVATSAAPGPPPLASDSAPMPRGGVAIHAVPVHIPTTVEPQNVAVSLSGLSVPPGVTASPTSPTRDLNDNSSQPLLRNLPSESHHGEKISPSSPPQNHPSSESHLPPPQGEPQASRRSSFKAAPPQPAPLPSNSESNTQDRHPPVPTWQQIVADMDSGQYLREEASRNTQPINPNPASDINTPPNNPQPREQHTASQFKFVRRPHPAIEVSQSVQGSLSSSPGPAPFVPASSATPPEPLLPNRGFLPELPQAETSSSTKRKSTSPLATAGSSYRFLQAQRVFEGGTGTAGPSSSAPGTATGYQIQPYSTASSSIALTSSVGQPAATTTRTTTAGPSQPKERKLKKTSNDTPTSGPRAQAQVTKTTSGGPGFPRFPDNSHKPKKSPVPTSVPKPTPPPPPRAIYSASAFDTPPYGQAGRAHHAADDDDPVTFQDFYPDIPASAFVNRPQGNSNGPGTGGNGSGVSGQGSRGQGPPPSHARYA